MINAALVEPQPSTVERFREWGSRQKLWRPKTVKQYTQRVQAAESWMLTTRQKPLEAATLNDLRAYMYSTKATAHNRNNIRTALVAFGEFCVETELRKKNLALKLERQKEPRHLPRPFAPNEVKRLLEAAEAYSPMFLCLVRLFLNTGLRLSEVQSLRWADVQAPRVVLFQKGGRERVTYLNAAAREALEEWAGYCPPSFWVFPSPRLENKPVGPDWIERKIRELGKRAGIEPCQVHRFRHTCISAVAKQSGLRTAQLVAGHSSIKTTERYAFQEEVLMGEALEKVSF